MNRYIPYISYTRGMACSTFALSLLAPSLLAPSLLAGCGSTLVALNTKETTPATDAPPDTIEDTETDTVGQGDDDDTTEITTPSEPVEIDLDVVDPWYGTTGHEITLGGGPFIEDAVVMFDDLEAQVIDVRRSELTVIVPDLGEDQTAEISVTTSEGASVVPLEFRYFEDGTGRIGALGTVEWSDFRGGYWDPSTVDSGFSQVMLPVPTDLSWAQLLYAGIQETCERDWQLGTTIYIYDPELPYLTVSSGTTQHLLPADATQPYIFYATDLPVRLGTAYDLEPMIGNPEWPDFGVRDLSGVVPNAMVVTSPNIDNGSFPTVSSTFTISWNGPYDGDMVLVWMRRMTWDGSTFVPQESVSCWLYDDGSYIVPGSMWSSWNTNDDYVYISVGRATLPQNVILPHNNARSDVVGVYWSVGFLDAE